MVDRPTALSKLRQYVKRKFQGLIAIFRKGRETTTEKTDTPLPKDMANCRNM